jgi:hypothetical protein
MYDKMIAGIRIVRLAAWMLYILLYSLIVYKLSTKYFFVLLASSLPTHAIPLYQEMIELNKELCHFAILQFCNFAILQFCCFAILQFYSKVLLQFYFIWKLPLGELWIIYFMYDKTIVATRTVGIGCMDAMYYSIIVYLKIINLKQNVLVISSP